MECTDTDKQTTCDIKQMAIIGKLHNMQWLKSNSQLSGHTKALPVEKELINQLLESKVNEETNECVEAISTSDTVSHSSKTDKTDNISSKDLDEGNTTINREKVDSLEVHNLPEKEMETVWNKDVNVPGALLPNSESLVVQRSEDKEKRDMSLTENTVTVKLEQFKLNEEEESSKSAESHNKGDNEWLSKSDNGNQVNPKQFHDNNNNNNAKSKSQSTLEVTKKCVQKTTKINTKKPNEQKIKKQPGIYVKEPSNNNVKQGNNKISTFTGDSNVIDKADSLEFCYKHDKYTYNKDFVTGKRTRTKEQQFSRPHFSTFNDSGNGSRSSAEGSSEKGKFVTTEFKVNKNESVKRGNELDDTKRYHQVQPLHSRYQSYNVQYNRSKPLIKSNQRYVRKLEDVNLLQGKPVRNPNATEFLTKSNSVPCKRNYQNLPIARNCTKDDQGYGQKFKRDSNTYRRSSGSVPPFLQASGSKPRMDDNKRNVSDNNSAKDYKVNPVSSIDTKAHFVYESSKVTMYLPKTGTGASNTKKTDTSESPTVNNVQSVKPLNPYSNNTKDSTAVNVSHESKVSQASCNKTEVQYVKTEQKDTSSNNSNNKTSTSNSDTKSVKFADNVQEINVMQRSTSFYSDLQATPNLSNAQKMETHQSVQNKCYFDNSNAQYSNTERDFQLTDPHQKQEPALHVSSQNHSGTTIPMGSSFQSIPSMYLSQYNTTQNVSRKTTDSTIIPQNALISSSSYNVENPNILQNDSSNVLLHNTQTSVLPPPGFHNHPMTSQHNQWNVPLPPEMFLFGNIMNPAPPMQLQNSRHVCNTDYNNIQQTGYLQHPMFCVTPLCMQSWNPLMQYPAPMYQNPPYANCTAYPNQVLPPNSLPDSVNCPVATSMHNDTYKHYQPVQQLENPPNFSAPVKIENYMGNVQSCKPTNVRVKDNPMDAHMRANQYRAPVANEYPNCSQDGQLMVPFSYGITMDSMARNCPSNVHMQMSQKYAPRSLTTANYQRMPDNCSAYQSTNQDSNSRKDDVSKNDLECIPPMVSPRECMYYGVNYARKTDAALNSTLRPDVKSFAYNMYSTSTHHYVPQFQRNATYHAKEVASNATIGRGKTDQ